MFTHWRLGCSDTVCFARRSKLDYKNLKEWMDTHHKGWEKNCGLVQVKDDATGRFEWLAPPAGTPEAAPEAAPA